MKNKLVAWLIFSSLVVGTLLVARTAFAATCTGSDPCHACKNCKYCKHCAKLGGKCGVCK